MRQRIAEIDAIIGPSTGSATPAPPGEPEPLSEGERTELFDRFRALNARIDSDLTEVPIDESGDETVWKYGGTYYETEEDAWEAWHADVERHAEIGARLRPYLDFSDDPDEPKLRLLTPEELGEKQAADERDRSAVPGDTRGGL